MNSQYPEESQEAKETVLHMPRRPDSSDIDVVWQYIENGLNRIIFEPTWGTDIPSLVGLYTAVHNLCTAQKPVGSGRFGQTPGGAHLLGEELYISLKTHIHEYLHTLKLRLKSLSGQVLLERYLDECNHYINAAQIVSYVFKYLNRYWIKREIDDGKSITDVYTLHLVLWHGELFKEISHLLIDAVSELVEKHREGEIMAFCPSKALIEFIVSLAPDGTDLSIAIRDVYGNLLETPLRITIETASDYYDLPAYLYSRPVTAYVRISGQASTETEEQLCTLVLHSGLKQRLTNSSNAASMIKLVSSDLIVYQKAAECSIIIKHLCTYFGRKIIAREVIPLPNVTGTVLHKVLEWCEHHKNDHITGLEPSTGYERRITTNIDEWDQKFFAVDQEMLFEIIHAANYLDIEPLLDLGCKTVANMIKGKHPEEIRKDFNITNDFTPEEEDQIHRENVWSEDAFGQIDWAEDAPDQIDWTDRGSKLALKNGSTPGQEEQSRAGKRSAHD